MKRIILVLMVLVAAGFALDWGIYGGPAAGGTMTNMSPVYDDITANGYEIPSIPSIQFNLATPITIRLFDFTIGWGEVFGWQSARGSEWKANLKHRLEITEFGYIINLSENMRLRPLVGLGDYDIDLTIAELGGGFGDPEEGDPQSYSYDYDNFSVTAGAAFAYQHKFENNVLVGLEAKARYLVPLQRNPAWKAPDFASYEDVYVEEFYPHTPVVGLQMFIGYEHLDADDFGWDEEELEEGGWEKETD